MRIIHSRSTLKENQDKLTKDREFIDQVNALEYQQDVSRHLQVKVDKPCVAAYFAGEAWPEAGERSTIFFALSAELRRVGLTEERAREIIINYYERLPGPIREELGKDRRPFFVKRQWKLLDQLTEVKK